VVNRVRRRAGEQEDVALERALEAPDSSTPERDAHRFRNGLIWTSALALLLLGIGLAVPDLRQVIDRVGNAGLGWVVLALALEILSCLGYVATVRLVLRRGAARQVRWLAWAEMAFGAVLPAGGAGGLAVGAWALRAWGISWSRIANRSAVIFLLTSTVNASVLALAGIGISLGVGSDRSGLTYGLAPAAIAVGAMSFFFALPWFTARRSRGTQDGRLMLALRRLAVWVRDSEAVALSLNWRLLGTIGYLLFDIAVLWACLRAVGVAAPLLALVVGYQVGYLADLLPIPGGVGALEGGLLGALLLYGLPAAPTAAAVILYHAIALWVPVLGGTAGFAALRKTVVASRNGRLPQELRADRPADERLPAAPQPSGDVGKLAA
jgi:uncharacterized membrane protein YbhN (UPF0104 family)